MANIARYSMGVSELAKKLGYNPQHVRLMAKTGKLPALKCVRKWLFDPEEVEAFLKRKTAEAMQ